MCGLEVVKWKIADLGQKIDPEAAEMLRRGYVDDGASGGSSDTVERLMGDEVWMDQKPSYTGTISLIFRPEHNYHRCGFYRRYLIKISFFGSEIIPSL